MEPTVGFRRCSEADKAISEFSRQIEGHLKGRKYEFIHLFRYRAKEQDSYGCQTYKGIYSGDISFIKDAIAEVVNPLAEREDFERKDLKGPRGPLVFVDLIGKRCFAALEDEVDWPSIAEKLQFKLEAFATDDTNSKLRHIARHYFHEPDPTCPLL